MHVADNRPIGREDAGAARRTTSAGRGGRRTESTRSTTSIRPPARWRRWCRSPARGRCARRSRRRGRRSPAGARCRRSGGRGRCWRCARSCCGAARSWSALVTADMGKTLADADGEVGRGIESVESAAAIPHLLKGETLEGVAAGVDVELVRQPVGVVAAITPFNFPAMIPLWFLPYAIACGNSFVLKPSEQDPRPAALIVEIVDSIEEIPPGVVNLVHGGRDAVDGDPRRPRRRRDLLRRPGRDGADHRRARRRDRQARAGAGRRQELAGGDARRRPRAGDAGDHGLGLRRRRTALPGRLGLRRRRRRGAAGGGPRRRWSRRPRR